MRKTRLQRACYSVGNLQPTIYVERCSLPLIEYSIRGVSQASPHRTSAPRLSLRHLRDPSSPPLSQLPLTCIFISIVSGLLGASDQRSGSPLTDDASVYLKKRSPIVEAARRHGTVIMGPPMYRICPLSSTFLRSSVIKQRSPTYAIPIRRARYIA